MTRLQWESVVRLLIAFCFASLFIFITRSDASSSSAGSLLGVAPQDESYYKAALAGGTIKCKDGSKKYTMSQLNDDFCDCLDGSDEPGTSACPNGSFYCKNAGHAPVVLFSSRINDGICDCCDGSDEYDGKTKCPNTCWEAGKAAREKLKKKIATYQEGVTIRKSEIELAKSSIAKEEAELQKLKDEEKVLKGLVDELRDRKEQIEKAEEKERLQKEKEEKERKEAELAKAKETNTDDAGTIGHIENDVHDKIGTEAAEDHLESDKEPEFSKHPTEAGLPDEDADDTKEFIQKSAEEHQESVKEPELSEHPTKAGLPDGDADDTKDFIQNSEELGKDSSIDTKVANDNGNQEKNADENAESLSREELGRRIASRWTGEKVEEQTPDASINNNDKNSDEKPSGTNYDEYHGFDSEDDEHTYDDDDKEDHVDDFQPEDHYDPSPPHVPDSDDESDLSDITGSSSSSWLDKIQQTVKTIIRAANIFQAPVNISDAEHIRKEFDESSSKLSKIQSRISSLTKKLKQDFGPEKEFYSFYGQCFESKQNKYVYKVCPFKQATQEEGYSTTRLGTWEKFDDSYRVMEFLNGDKCWNGPDRSLKVRLRCGLKNEVADVDEPSRCEYAALLSTPALCLESKLKELQEKLEKLNTEIPQGHDEL